MTRNSLKNQVIGLSASPSADLLNLGFGTDHLREALIRLARPMVRAGASLAYGGHFDEGSLTHELIELISEEQREGTTDQRPWIGILYNHSAWPHYKAVSPEDEAKYVEVCRFLRITQELAGLTEVVTEDTEPSPEHRLFNQAVVLTAMRRFMAYGMEIERAAGKPDVIPPVAARVFIGGKTEGFSGVLPGLFEEALFCLESETPLFILGGYGGASAMLANFVRKKLNKRSALLDLNALYEGTPDLKTLQSSFENTPVPAGARSPAEQVADLAARLSAAKTDIPGVLRNGLTLKENKRLFETTDTAEAAKLVLDGLERAL